MLKQAYIDRKFFKTFGNNLLDLCDGLDENRYEQIKQKGAQYSEKGEGWDSHSFWYGAKVDIRPFDAPDPTALFGYSAPDICVKTREPFLISGMFTEIASAWPTEIEDTSFGHLDKLRFYAKAAHRVIEHERHDGLFDPAFVKSFYRDLAISFLQLVGQVDSYLHENDHTRFLETNFEVGSDFDGINDDTRYAFYFAYGSNMDPTQMHERCPGAKPVAIAMRDGYRLIINSRGVATITKEEDAHCYGILWAVTEQHVKDLDRCEGVSYGTYKRKILSVTVGNKKLDAFIYIAKDEAIGSPRDGYLDKLKAGVEFFDGHSEWREQISQLDIIEYLG